MVIMWIHQKEIQGFSCHLDCANTSSIAANLPLQWACNLRRHKVNRCLCLWVQTCSETKAWFFASQKAFADVHTHFICVRDTNQKACVAKSFFFSIVRILDICKVRQKVSWFLYFLSFLVDDTGIRKLLTPASDDIRNSCQWWCFKTSVTVTERLCLLAFPALFVGTGIRLLTTSIDSDQTCDFHSDTWHVIKRVTFNQKCETKSNMWLSNK